MKIPNLENYYKKHFGKRDILVAYELLADEQELISFLIYSYNYYAIRYNARYERSAMSLITNPNELFKDDTEKKEFIALFKKYIIETVNNKYISNEANNGTDTQNN